MSKIDSKFKRFSNLKGHLQKLSSNLLLGYQPRFWRILDNGTKIGYSSSPEEQVKAQNLFLIKQCFASEGTDNRIFQLQIGDKTFCLRAPNQQQRIDWIKGVTYLNKLVTNQIKLKIQNSPTQTTIASRSQKLKVKKSSKIQSTISLPLQKSRIFQPQDLASNDRIQQDLIVQLKKYLPQKCLKYNTLLTNLQIKTQGIFLDSFNSDTYLLISPKSLYPQIFINEENLTNISLPSWLQINRFYKISNSKDKKKQIFHINKIIDIKQGSQKCSLKINIGQIIYEFFTETVQQKQCLENCLRIAIQNQSEVDLKSKYYKRNFDKLIDLHQRRQPQFQLQAKKIVQSFMKPEEERKFQPKQLFQFMDKSMNFLNEFIDVLQHKNKDKSHVIIDMLKQFHQQVKIQIKLTWDSNFFKIKGYDILNILKKLSQYFNLMKNFIKSAQFLEGMKQLSKIYVRQSWKNFQSIIIGIVQQQKKHNFLEDQFCDYVQTNGVTDLFKFIYSVFDLAYPNWKHKIHLHNVNRLMQRALQVFVNQLRSTVNQQQMPQKQIIGLANNYFAFNEYTKEFYSQKFGELVQKTQQNYEKITNSYRQLSTIILQKIALRVSLLIQTYSTKCTIQTFKCNVVQQILQKQGESLQKMLHMAFVKKLYQKISKQIHIIICNLLIEQCKAKKKIKLKQIMRSIKQIRAGLAVVFENIGKSKISIDKKMGQIQTILTMDLYSDIQNVIVANPEPIKSIYLIILQLRDDYSEGSALFRTVNQLNFVGNKGQEHRKSIISRKLSVDVAQRDNRATISKQYFQQQLIDSDQNQNHGIINQQTKNGSNNLRPTEPKLITEGYLTKGKRNQKVWEKQYFRLKNGYLYIFQSEDADRCRNAIQIKNISKIQVTNPEKPSFLLTYNNIGKQKQMKLKADSVQLRERWVNSLGLQKKRMQNQQQVKKKAVKYQQNQNNIARKKNQMIIDYQELEKGKDYFSYSN